MLTFALKVNKNKRKNKEMDAARTEKSVLSQLRELEVGCELTFPLERRSSVKSTVSTFAPEWNKKFTIKSDNAARTFTVTRIR